MWAFPHTTGTSGAPIDSVTPRHVPNSTRTFTQAQAQDFFRVLEWHHEALPPAPSIVIHGRKPAVFACGYCHLADGIGRPENAMLAGLSEAYIIAQIGDLRSGARTSAWAPYKPAAGMRQVAESASETEIAQAARYFSHLHARARSHVVESTIVPRSIEANGLYLRDPHGGSEPLGNRVIDMAMDGEAHELHDPFTRYVSYVPPGSISRGRALATIDRGTATKPCTSCHGPQLRGVGLVPPIAGRAPSYIMRQLIAFKMGTRSSAAAAPMRDEAATLSLDDMIAAAAYAGSRRP